MLIQNYYQKKVYPICGGFFVVKKEERRRKRLIGTPPPKKNKNGTESIEQEPVKKCLVLDSISKIGVCIYIVRRQYQLAIYSLKFCSHA